MSGALQVTGILSHAPATGGADFDGDLIRAYATRQEAAGFDRVLIANSARMPDSFAIGTAVAHATSRLGLMMAHRPGFVAPTRAAAMLATIDRLSGGRAGVHIIPGASDLELRQDGDFLDKDARIHRALDYVGVMRRAWASAEPFDHDSDFYRLRGARLAVRPASGAVRVFWGGESDLAIELGARCADVYALIGDTLAGVAGLIAQARAAAARAGRSIEILMTMAVILGDNEDEAWARAKTERARLEPVAAAMKAEGAASLDKEWLRSNALRRIAARVAEGERLDSCFWTGLNKVMGGRGNHGALVGTPDQVADALDAYRRIGVDNVLLRGFDPLADIDRMGRDLLPALRDRQRTPLLA